MALPPMAATALLKDVINAATNYAMCKEHERTERTRIAATLEAKLTLINTQYNEFSASLVENHVQFMQAYEIFGSLLKNPTFYENANAVKEVLTFLQNVHESSGKRISEMVDSASRMRL